MEKLPTPEEVRTEADEAWRDWSGYGAKAMAVLRAYESGRLVDRSAGIPMLCVGGLTGACYPVRDRSEQPDGYLFPATPESGT